MKCKKSGIRHPLDCTEIVGGRARGLCYLFYHRIGRGIGAPGFNIGLDGYFLFHDLRVKWTPNLVELAFRQRPNP